MKAWEKTCCLSILCLSAVSFAGCGAKESSELPVYSEEKEGTKLPSYSEVIHSTGSKTGEEEDSTSGTIEPFDFYSDGRPSPEQLEYAAQRYTFWTSNECSIAMNGLGEILGTEDVKVSRIEDVLTGEARYYEAAYKTYRKREDWGYDISYTSRVYDSSGNLVIDWDETTYVNCIGEWLFTQKYMDINMVEEDWAPKGRLINSRTKEEMPDVIAIEKLDADTVFVETTDPGQTFTMDARGNILCDFSQVKKDIAGEYTLNCYSGYIVAVKDNDSMSRLTFYSPGGKLLGTINGVENSYLYNTDIIQPYIMCDNAIYLPDQGDGGELEPVFWMEDTLYYDGERAVCASCREDGSRSYRLYDVKTGEALSAGYEMIAETPIQGIREERTPVSFFIGANSDKIEKLDRSGKVIAEAAIENVCGVNIYNSAIIVFLDDYEKHCLLDQQLNVVIPGDKYISIHPVYDEQGTENTGLWVGEYYFDQRQMYIRSDLLNTDGEIINSGYSYIGGSINGRIPVIRGQSLGLIDPRGNWLIKMPKHELNNED